MWTFHITTFGCKVNQYESQALREAWLVRGGVECATPALADVTLINSCAVTAKGERDARNACYRLHREAPTARHILTGCATHLVEAYLMGQNCAPIYVPARAKALLLRGPWVLNFCQKPTPPATSFPQKRESSQDISNAHGAYRDTIDTVPVFGPEGFCIRDFARARAVVKIQDGCSHRCTYCIVPLVRGPNVSRAPQEILAEVTALMEAGFGEIMLSGINLGQYGRGTNYGDFWDVVRLLDTALAPRFAGRARLRISSVEPTQLDTRGLDTLCAGRLLCPHIHIALQHGSPQILRRMGRGHIRLPRLLDAVAALRREWPVMGLGADILIGSPGESKADVDATLDMLATMGLTYAHVFPYSARPGTAAASFTAPVPHADKLARAKAVRRAVDAQKQAFIHSLCHLPALTVVADTGPKEATTEDHACRAVSEHYAPCRIVGAGTISTGRGLQGVRPLGVEAGMLCVTPI